MHVCLPQEQVINGTGKPGACTSGGFTLVLVARRSQAAWPHIAGVPEREFTLRICAREEAALQPIHTKMLKNKFD